MARRRRQSAKLSAEPVTAAIESLSHEGRGITHVDDKVVFIDGAIAGEHVRFRYTRTHRNYDEGEVVEVLQASPDRVEPRCPSFGICGGCSLQHIRPEQQIQMKQELLLNLLMRTSQLAPEQILPPLSADYWGYRTKARLGVRYVRKKERMLVGFREKRKSYLTDMDRCEVIDQRVGHHLTEIADCLASLDAFDKIAQIEMAATEDRVALVFRNLVELSAEDTNKLIALGRQYDFDIYLQSGGPETVTLIYPQAAELSYRIRAYDLSIQFTPTDFTQINLAINNQMIEQAIELLALDASHDVLDLFCGLGNFSLPMARQARHVTGVEGDAGLIERANQNARRNRIDNVEFHVQDLSQDCQHQPWLQRHYDRVLIDPARPGALEMMPQVAATGAERIVYVSCNPATLARDAGELVNRHGYHLQAAGVMDMFPHTAHVESMALFTKR